MEAWAKEVLIGVLDYWQNKKNPWEIKGDDQIFYEMVGGWKRVVFFVKTNWEGEIHDVRITFVFKIAGFFHVSGKMKAIVIPLPELAGDKDLNDIPVRVQDAIIETTHAMDKFMVEISENDAENLQKRLVYEVPTLIKNALDFLTTATIYGGIVHSSS